MAKSRPLTRKDFRMSAVEQKACWKERRRIDATERERVTIRRWLNRDHLQRKTSEMSVAKQKVGALVWVTACYASQTASSGDIGPERKEVRLWVGDTPGSETGIARWSACSLWSVWEVNLK
ncbi:hypothetical protein AVEN_12316-1 [Araneus ventricosus]|uniref:Uncharacterized protein n=1 Tax=Araneus ventricosus TaxID=182803 RepID=A0A4Y2E908_ARAVE|nr:hypothetical protein AVEN_12316-1 [Araneus ventricosus]